MDHGHRLKRAEWSFGCSGSNVLYLLSYLMHYFNTWGFQSTHMNLKMMCYLWILEIEWKNCFECNLGRVRPYVPNMVGFGDWEYQFRSKHFQNYAMDRSIHISCIYTLLCPNVLSYLSFVSKVIRKDSVENVKLLFIHNCCCAAVANWCKLHMKPAAAGFLIYIWNGSPILEAELLLLRSGLSVLPPL